MGQEDEESNERIEQIRREHHAIKAWYNNNDTSEEKVGLRSKYGDYPTFWQDVSKWEGYKSTWKLYWKEKENPRTSSNSENPEKKDRKKRKSRWSSRPDETPAAPISNVEEKKKVDQHDQQDQQDQQEPQKKRKSRWSSRESNPIPATKPTAETGILGLLPGMPSGITRDQLKKLAELQKRLKYVNQRLNNLDIEAARIDSLPRGHPSRSPSPPPIYGADGVRTNTRAVRWREKFTNERQDCLEQIMELNPSLRPPGFVKRKRTKKIFIPVEEHPTYNFIGLIIGPRGKTQKEMETKTGCKIAIRGRGSVKEGARGRRDGKPMEGDDEPLHVVVTGEDQASVDLAASMINEMLVVIDDEKNVHKQQQLRELALLNGTLKDEEWCHLCAEKGHRSFECPKRFAISTKKVNVKCAICGDTSHPTRDCARKTVDTEQVDKDYLSFMAELDGKKNAAVNAATAPSSTETTEVCQRVPETTSAATAPEQTLTAAETAQAQAAALQEQQAAYIQQQQEQQKQAQQAYLAYQQQMAAYQQSLYQQQYAAYASTQPQQPASTNVDDLTAGWDYKSYYGNGAASGQSGGFNWWGSS